MNLNNQPKVDPPIYENNKRDKKMPQQRQYTDESSSEDDDTYHESDLTRINGRNHHRSVNVVSKDMASI